MRRRTIVALAAVALLAVPAAAHAATVKQGKACHIKGRQVTVAHTRYQCVQRSKRLVWAKVRPIAKPTPTAAALSGEITVFAAASLTEAFTALADQFQTVNPKVHVTMSFGGSSSLATQVINGAPADVFASASTTNMQQVVDATQATNPSTFARNRMIVVTPPGNPAHITALADLAKPGIKVAVCQAKVPCGVTANAVFGNAHLAVTPVTFEADVKAVLTKVALGEVDAGIVYVTDARSAGATVNAIVIPAELNAETTYPIALLRASAQPAIAKAFIDFVLSDRGAAALAAVGFTVL